MPPQKKINPIHTDPDVQHVDVRVYFPKDGYAHDDVVDKVADALQNSPELAGMVSAYELKGAATGQVLAPDGAPLA